MYRLSKVNNTYDGFCKLIDLSESYKDTYFENIEIEIASFFAANLCASLGVILDKMSSNVNSIELRVSDKVKNILQRNCFLSNYGYESAFDWNDTTIPYTKFARSESKTFAKFVSKNLLTRTSMPNLSEKLRFRVLETICELFANSSIHTKTPYIYACGQYYPNQNLLDFTIADMGEGIRQNVGNHLNENITSEDAIRWALIDGHTTKLNIPGGYGLGILKSLINHNKGFMQIVSDDGFYSLSNGGEEYKTFKGKFPGTVINIQFITDDTAYYELSDE